MLIIDDFVADPVALRAKAQALIYKPMGKHYPGVRASVAPQDVAAYLAPVEQIIMETFGLHTPPRLVEAMYSLVTTPPARLTPIQRIPHYDGLQPGCLALLHYLGEAEMGGTGFYRHKSTGFEQITADNHSAYDAALHRDVAHHGLPAPAYIGGDTPLFERIARYEARFNRAIIYRGHVLHCADLPAHPNLSADPQAGRLTVNTFLMGD
ncbi:MAG: hypothetical protein KGQ42_02380 [Alphaproteobacteria bacterium]|nr:hypothetical protein [Alphaproteobacteria bacterium]MDE2042183.1 hypothetical protein [Alphaproteobacteria bacterium]MDE2340963.1 hypothetical protein [Alphaproteobacteria bacterium]